MNRADEIKAKSKLLADGPLMQPTSTVRTEPFRLSVDLPPIMHNQLQRWTADSGAEIGRRVPAARVVRVLLTRMFTDEDLQQAVLDDLRTYG